MNNKSAFLKFLINPFERIAGAKALLIGLAVMLATAFIGSLSGTAFDGVLDVHIYAHSFLYAITIQLTAWIILVLLMWASIKLFTRAKVRLIDLAGTLAFARIPFFFLAFSGFIPALKNIGMDIFSKLPLILMFALFSLLFIGWSIYWMFKAVSVSANLKKMGHVLLFAVVLIVAEIVSLPAIHYGVRKFENTNISQQQPTNLPEETEETVLSKTKKITEAIENADFETIISYFDDEMMQQLPIGKLDKTWEQVQLQVGKFEGFDDDTTITEEDNYIITHSTARFEKLKLTLQLTFDENGEISGFYVKPKLF